VSRAAGVGVGGVGWGGWVGWGGRGALWRYAGHSAPVHGSLTLVMVRVFVRNNLTMKTFGSQAQGARKGEWGGEVEVGGWVGA